MYNPKNLLYCLSILELIEKIRIYVADFSVYKDLLDANDQMNYNATLHGLLVIGEESKKIEPGLRDEFATIPWSNIVGMRNYLAHDYRGIDPERVFTVASHYLEPLQNALMQMINRIDYEPMMLQEALDSTYYRHIQYLRTKLTD
jgi:uncharacterized protein with HEPN domain